MRRQRWWRPRRRPPDTNSRAPHAFKVSCGQATIGSLRSLGAVTHRPITRLPITCPPRRARAARLLATAAARPRAATLPCAPDRARAAQTARALADRAAAAQAVAAPPRPNPSARACRCRRRRHHRRRVSPRRHASLKTGRARPCQPTRLPASPGSTHGRALAARVRATCSDRGPLSRLSFFQRVAAK